jgi:hypothetical protein
MECEMCAREGLTLRLVKPSKLLDDADEPRWLCRRDRVIRRFLVVGAWIFTLAGTTHGATPG